MSKIEKPQANPDKQIPPEKLKEYQDSLRNFQEFLPQLEEIAGSRGTMEVDGEKTTYEFGIETGRYSFTIRPKLEPDLLRMNPNSTNRLWNLRAEQRPPENSEEAANFTPNTIEIWFKNKNAVVIRYNEQEVAVIDPENGTYQSQQGIEEIMEILAKLRTDLDTYKAKYGQDAVPNLRDF